MTSSQRKATKAAIRKIAWHTAQGIGKRALDAKKHCKQLGIDYRKPLSQ